MADDAGKPRLPDDDDISARFEKIREQLHGMDLPELPEAEIERLQSGVATPKVDHANVESRLKDLESRAQHAKGQYQTAINKPTPKEVESSSKSTRGLALGMMIAYTIMGLPLAGIGIGALIDWWLGSVMGKGIGALAGSVLGVTMAIKMINANANKVN